jgi:hypothetical protein
MYNPRPERDGSPGFGRFHKSLIFEAGVHTIVSAEKKQRITARRVFGGGFRCVVDPVKFPFRLAALSFFRFTFPLDVRSMRPLVGLDVYKPAFFIPDGVQLGA